MVRQEKPKNRPRFPPTAAKKYNSQIMGYGYLT